MYNMTVPLKEPGGPGSRTCHGKERNLEIPRLVGFVGTCYHGHHHRSNIWGYWGFGCGGFGAPLSPRLRELGECGSVDVNRCKKLILESWI